MLPCLVAIVCGGGDCIRFLFPPTVFLGGMIFFGLKVPLLAPLLAQTASSGSTLTAELPLAGRDRRTG